MTNYQKTKIYKIESHLGDKIYVGSTAKEYLSQRFQLMNTYKKWKETKLKKVTSFDLFDEYGPENCQIVLIESYPCTSKDEKNAKEGHFIKTLECVNKVIPGRTKKQYYEDNKEVIKQYNSNNKDTMLEYQKQYRSDNKEAILISKKQYNSDNKEAINQKRREIYQRNKAEN